MLIWRGWGLLTLVTMAAGIILVQLVVNAIGGIGTTEADPYLFGGPGVIVGGIATYLLGRWLDGRNPPRELVDQKTGQRVVMQSRNDLFWISMPTWGLVGIVAGATMLLLGIFGRITAG